jgi:hypothetical protein
LRSVAAPLVCGAALLLSACGSSTQITPAAARLEREDLVIVSHTLSGMRQEIAAEVTATKAAWPFVVNGLATPASSSSLLAIHTAAQRSAQLKLPTLFQEGRASSITGPASTLAVLVRSYTLLASRGWKLIAGAIEQIEHGSPVAARFARANVALYVESVYDAHFSLAQIGKLLAAGYKKLGGAAAFGISLSEAEVDALSATYSEASDRLHPHTGVRLGS